MGQIWVEFKAPAFSIARPQLSWLVESQPVILAPAGLGQSALHLKAVDVERTKKRLRNYFIGQVTEILMALLK